MKTFVQDILVNAAHILEAEENSVEFSKAALLATSSERSKPSATHVMVEPLDLDVTNDSETDAGESVSGATSANQVDSKSSNRGDSLAKMRQEFIQNAPSLSSNQGNSFAKAPSKSCSENGQSSATVEVPSFCAMSSTIVGDESLEVADTKLQESSQKLDEVVVPKTSSDTWTASEQPSIPGCVSPTNHGSFTVNEEVSAPNVVADLCTTSDPPNTTPEVAPGQSVHSTLNACVENVCVEASTIHEEETVYYDVEEGKSKSDEEPSKIQDDTNLFGESLTTDEDSTFTGNDSSKLDATASNIDKTDTTTSDATTEAKPLDSVTEKDTVPQALSNRSMPEVPCSISKDLDEVVESDPKANKTSDLTADAEAPDAEDLESNDTVPPMKLSVVTNRGMISELGNYEYKDDFESVCSTPFKSKHSIDTVPVADIVTEESPKVFLEESDLDVQAHELAAQAINLAIDSVEDMAEDITPDMTLD